MSKLNILDAYVHVAPSAQNAVDLFKGEWSSRFPAPLADLAAGTVPLFADGRIPWALAKLGGVEGQTVLELGPLEGGHSYMLEKAGASSVLAIEANSRAYLKCLIAKELLGMPRVRFELGDFVSFLQETDQQFDLIFASGVLYHMKDPVALLRAMAARTRRLYLWTHYYDEPTMQKVDPGIAANFDEIQKLDVDGITVTLHRQLYRQALEGKTFCGGGEHFSNWLEQDDIVNLLKHFGFTQIEIDHVNLQHPHGASFSVAASKG